MVKGREKSLGRPKGWDLYTHVEGLVFSRGKEEKVRTDKGRFTDLVVRA